MDEKAFEDFLLNPESRKRVHKTVREAVNRADAAGLPPAYEPAFSKLKEFRAEQKKSREELLELRRQARIEKANKDQVNLEFHRKVFDLLEEGGQAAGFIMRKALEMIEMWDQKGLNSMYSPMWKQLLDGSPAAARDFVLSDAANGWPLGLRSSSPFTHLIAFPGDEWDGGANLLTH